MSIFLNTLQIRNSGFHLLLGGAHPEVDKREFRLTLIAFIVQICNTFFFFNNVSN